MFLIPSFLLVPEPSLFPSRSQEVGAWCEGRDWGEAARGQAPLAGNCGRIRRELWLWNRHRYSPGDTFLPCSPLLGHSSVGGLAPQPLKPSLVLAEPSRHGPKLPVTQRAHTWLSPHHQGDSRDPPQPPPAAAPGAEGSSPLPALHISIGARARRLQRRRSRIWDPSAAALWALTGLVAPDTGDTGDPGGSPSFLVPGGLPRPTLYTRTECQTPLSSKDTSGMDILSWLHSTTAGEGLYGFIDSDLLILSFHLAFYLFSILSV